MATQTISPRQALLDARTRFSQAEIARIVSKNARTVRRWEKGEVEPPALIVPALREALGASHGDNSSGEFTFADLFAGIGGIRLGFESAGGECVFTSEWNNWAVKTYTANFGEGHPLVGDVTKVEAADIPNHDVLLAGFPCQPFSIAGVSKKNALGRPHGFECTTQGTLFFDVARIIAEKRPAAFLLENVKNLVSHDRHNTFRVILQTLREELGYDVRWKIIDGRNWVPQHRERIVIVGFRDRTDFTWDALQVPRNPPRLRAVLHPQNGKEPTLEHDDGRFVNSKGRVSSKYTLTDHLWKYLRDYAEKHRLKGNGFGFGLVDSKGVARTLSARYFKDGSEILISRGKRGNPRRLTPRECARLMGFPDSFRIPVSDTQAYKQFGNSVIVPVMSEVARIMKPHILAIRDDTRAKQGLLFAA